MSIISVKNLSYSYESASKKVLNDINIEFDKGKLYSVMGHSGAGKSTLLSLISGLEQPTYGDIFINNENLRTFNRDIYRARQIGVIFQGYNLLNNATAIENIILSMQISGIKIKNKKEYAYSLLEKFGIDKITADRKILKLSGGEQQRIGIARALSHNPEVIIADEPTGNLDVETENSIMNIFSDLAKEENKCVIIVTHSQKVASFAQQILYLQKGSLLLNKNI